MTDKNPLDYETPRTGERRARHWLLWAAVGVLLALVASMLAWLVAGCGP